MLTISKPLSADRRGATTPRSFRTRVRTTTRMPIGFVGRGRDGWPPCGVLSARSGTNSSSASQTASIPSPANNSSDIRPPARPRTPTARRSAHKLAEAASESSTLQRHLARGDGEEAHTIEQKRLHVLDESSLASTKQMHTFLTRLGPEDRVLLVGDVRQHEAVEAGRPYHQLQEAGVYTAHLDDIVRQQDPELKAVVEQLAHGDVRGAVEALDGRAGCMRSGPARNAWPRWPGYLKDPHGTLVVSPDNQSEKTSMSDPPQHATRGAR